MCCFCLRAGLPLLRCVAVIRWNYVQMRYVGGARVGLCVVTIHVFLSGEFVVYTEEGSCSVIITGAGRKWEKRSAKKLPSRTCPMSPRAVRQDQWSRRDDRWYYH
jgi:hypothetical protein